MTEPTASNPARVRGIVFDLDGTLIDGYDAIATGVNAARAAFALPPLTVEDVRRRVGLGLSHLMDDVVGPEHAAAGSAIFREAYARVMEDETRPVPGLTGTLGELARRGFRMAVASNKPAAFSTLILERLGVRARFDAVLGPESVGSAKPDPAMIASCLQAMHVTADEALYVGDMTLDDLAGSRAGVAVVLISGGSCPDEELRATGRVVLARLADLLDWLT